MKERLPSFFFSSTISQLGCNAFVFLNPVHGSARYAYGASVADDNVLAAHAPTFSIGPLGGGEHTRGEWASKESCLQLAGIAREFVRRL